MKIAIRKKLGELSELDNDLARDIYYRFSLWVDPHFRKASGLEEYLSL